MSAVEKARRFLAVGGLGMLVGIAISATGHATVGSVVTLAAAAAFFGGVHSLGRAGPDAG